MYRQMKVSALVLDPQTNTPIVILRDLKNELSLPIWIGLLEATAIASELENIQFPRPMTHDLIRNCFEFLNVKVERVEVCDLRNNTYYALLYLRDRDHISPVDARPSDAIAIALRTKAPIFVKEDVITKSNRTQETPRVFDEENREKWSELLEQLDPEEFSKYKM